MFATLIGDMFGDEILKILGELDDEFIILDDCERVMEFGEKSNGAFFIAGMGLNGEFRPVLDIIIKFSTRNRIT